MEPIDISSSDSIFDTDDDDAEIVSTPVGTRVLPHWASSSGINATRVEGNEGQSEKASSPRAPSSNERSSDSHSFPSSGADGRVLNSFMQLDDNSRYYKENGTNGQLNGSSINWNTTKSNNLSNTEYERHLIPQSVKRTLPSSFQPSVPRGKFNNSRDNEGSSRHDVGRSYHLAGPSGLTGKNYVNDNVKRGNGDVILLDNNGSRLLPPSLMRGRPAPTQYNSSSDSLRFGIGEERIAGHDERLIYQAALQDLSQPKTELNLPDGLLAVPLLRHQKIALAWMLQKETKSVHCLGGILADDQGLGKTISMIALILMQKFLQLKSKSEDQSNSNLKAEALNLDDDDDGGCVNVENVRQIGDSVVKCSPEASSSQRAFHGKRPAAGTLVICPATVLRQWARELGDKAGEEAKLATLVYHGGNRTKDPSELARFDVVLTTYSIVANEVPKRPLIDDDDVEQKVAEEYGLSSEFSINRKRKIPSNNSKRRKKGRKGIDSCAIDSDSGPLARVAWLRVVLDEAQTIKNHRTQVARACCGLRAKRRWCLSGTPIQNAIDELYSYFRFLKYEPYSAYKAFCEGVKIPITRDPVRGFMKLQAILRAVMLRRTKETVIDGQPIIRLPPKVVDLKKVTFTAEELAFYLELEADSKTRFKECAAVEEEVEAGWVASPPGADLTREIVVVGMVQESEPPSIPLSPVAPDVPSSTEVVAEHVELPSLLASGGGPCRTDASLAQECAAVEEEVEAGWVASQPGVDLTREIVMVGMVQESKPPSVSLSPVAPDVPSSTEVVAEHVEPPSLLASGGGPRRTDASLAQVLGETNSIDAVFAQLRGYFHRVREESEQEIARHTGVEIAALRGENERLREENERLMQEGVRLRQEVEHLKGLASTLEDDISRLSTDLRLRLTPEEVRLALDTRFWEGIRLCSRIASVALPGVSVSIFHPGNTGISDSSRLRDFPEEAGPSDP